MDQSPGSGTSRSEEHAWRWGRCCGGAGLECRRRAEQGGAGRRCRRRRCGACAAKRSRSGARAAAEGRRRSGGGGAAYGRGCRAAVSRGGRKTVKLTRGPAEGLSENKTGGPANPKHRKVQWFGEKTVGVITGVTLTRSDLRGKHGQKGTGRTVTGASEHPMGVGATAGVRSRDTARAKTPHSSTG